MSLKSTRSATSTLLKLFKSSSSAKPESATIRPSATAKSFMKQTSCESTASVTVAAAEAEDLNESDMSVVGLPPTPLKPEERPAAHNSGVSSQILPLHRLSSESFLPPRSIATTSAPMPPPPAYKEPPKPKPMTTLTGGDALLSRLKPVAEVSPFSSAQVGLDIGFCTL